MYFKFICPSCAKGLKVREEHVGKRTRCPYCKKPVTITAPQESEEPSEQEVDPLDQLAAAAGPEQAAPQDDSSVPVARVRSRSSDSGSKRKTQPRTTETSSQAASQVSGTDVSQILSLAMGLAFGVVVYAILYTAMPKSYLGQLFIERGWVPFVLVILMGWSGGILILKSINLRRQKESMLFDVLPTDISESITIENTRQFADQIRELPGEARQSFLLNRVLRGLEHFRVRRNTQEVATVLSSQSDIDATSVQSSYTIIKVFIWAIPILGFIGTVIGIGESIGSFTGAMDSAEDVAKLKESLSGVTGGLATAFDTTLIALVMSLLVMFPTSSMQKSEEDLLNWVDEYCNENLLKRLKDASGIEEGEFARQVRKAIDVAMDKHHAEFAASALMLEKTSGRGADLANKVAQLQEVHLVRMNELAEAMDRQEAALQARLHANAQTVEQYLGSVSDGMISLNELLAKLDGKQVVVQQEKRGWFGRSKGKNNGDG